MPRSRWGGVGGIAWAAACALYLQNAAESNLNTPGFGGTTRSGPLKLKDVERTWNFIFLIKSLKTFRIHWTVIIIVSASEKLFSKRLWHRLRLPAVIVLNVHGGLRGQQQLGALDRRLLAKGAAVDVMASGPGAQKPPGAVGGAADVRGAEVRLRCLMQHTTTTWPGGRELFNWFCLTSRFV